jgi:hypothetical protein
MVCTSNAFHSNAADSPAGVPVAWMLSSNGTQATIQFPLEFVKCQSPDVSPSIFMTDQDQAQVNAICDTYPSSWVFYFGWWHVLRAIRSHFITMEFKDLWVRTTDQYEFDAWWEDICSDDTIPKSVAQYCHGCVVLFVF